MNYSQVEFEVEDHVAIVKLNRPEKLNAWSDVMAKEVYECMKISDHAFNFSGRFNFTIATWSSNSNSTCE